MILKKTKIDCSGEDEITHWKIFENIGFWKQTIHSSIVWEVNGPMCEPLNTKQYGLPQEEENSIVVLFQLIDDEL